MLRSILPNADGNLCRLSRGMHVFRRRKLLDRKGRAPDAYQCRAPGICCRLRIARQFPAYILHLGTDLEQIPTLVREFLAK
jgi:hypothetical protein